MADRRKRKVGRPSSFDPDDLPRVTKLALLGASNAMMAQVFEVHESQIERWTRDNPEFRMALKAGRIDADGNVARSLYDNALGGVHLVDEVVTLKTKHSDGSYEERAEVIQVEKYFPPNTTAQIFFLKNRQRAIWTDVNRVEMTGANGGPIEHRTIAGKQLEAGEREALRSFLEARMNAEDVETVGYEEDQDDDDGSDARD